MITPERALTTAALQSMLAGLPDPLCCVDQAWRITHVNAPFTAFAGVDATELLGAALWSVLPELSGSPVEAAGNQALVNGSVTDVAHLQVRNGWYSVRCIPIENGLGVYWRGVSAQMVGVWPDEHPQASTAERRSRQQPDAAGAGMDLQDLNAALEERVEERTYQLLKATEELAARNRAFEAFAVLSRELRTETDEVRLVQRAQDTVLDLLPEGACAYFEQHGESWRLQAASGAVHEAQLAVLREHPFPRGRSTTFDRVCEAGQPVYLQRNQLREKFPSFPLLNHFGALAVLPLSFADAGSGVLVVALTRQHVWTARDRAVLDTAVSQLQLALERSRAIHLVEQRNKLLDRRASQLQELNGELAAFSHSVSHDLRTPLRHISSFASLLAHRAASLDERERKMLGTIVASAARMDGMIQGLLAFSNVAQQSLRFTPVDLTELVEQVRRDLEVDQGERNVDWRIQSLPTVRGDAATLRMVFTNLLGNALKYTGQREHATIGVSASTTDEEHVVTVRDNGAGFDPSRAGNLFGMFQRLHEQAEFEGIGIGLSTVRRIVSRHGGRVWAEGNVGQGAAFHVALPRAGQGAISDVR